jgi:hypothetical protein
MKTENKHSHFINIGQSRENLQSSEKGECKKLYIPDDSQEKGPKRVVINT